MSSHAARKRVSGKKQNAESESPRRPDKRSRLTKAELLQQLQAERSARLATEQLIEGTYYATFDEVWGTDDVSFDNSDYEAMIRDRFPSYGMDQSDRKWKAFFEETAKHAANPNLEVASRGSRSSLDISLKESIWPVDVLRSKFDDLGNRTKFIQLGEQPNHDASNESMTGNAATSIYGSEIAHLVPASSTLAPFYHHVAVWVFGVKPDNIPLNNPSSVQKLIAGSSYLARDGQRRHDMTGLKYMYCNMIRLSAQAVFFDQHPSVIIVPVLTLLHAKNWNGEGYHALFMISTGSCDDSNYDGKLRNVAAGVKMQDIGETANEIEINAAEELLTATVKGLADALVNKSDDKARWVSALPEKVPKEKLGELQNFFSSITGEKKIKIPKRKGTMKPVRKITFAPAFAPGTSGHPAPDPLLLAVKAAVNWSRFHKQPLLAAAEPDDSDCDMSEGWLPVLESYIAMKDHFERTSRDEEIMKMTINIP